MSHCGFWTCRKKDEKNLWMPGAVSCAPSLSSSISHFFWLSFWHSTWHLASFWHSLWYIVKYVRICSNIVQHLPPLFLASKSKRFTWLESRLSLVVLVFGRFAGFVWLGCWLMLVAVVLFDFLLHAFAVVCVVLLLAWLHVSTSPALPNADRCLALFKV